MTSKARRLWVANVEEAFPTRGPADDSWVLARLAGEAPGCLFPLAPGDALLVSHPVDGALRTYLRQVLGFGKEPLPVLVPGTRPSPWFLADAVQADHQVFGQLRALVATGSWVLEPFLETARIHRLGAALGLSSGRSRREAVEGGLIERVNDRQAFKRLAREAGIPVIPGTVAGSATEARKQTFRIPPGPDGRLMVRHSRPRDGRDHLAGDPESLRDLLPDWFRPGQVLIEPMLSFVSTLGIVVELGEEASVLRGVGENLFEDRRWTGFQAPPRDAAVGARVARDTMRLADSLRSQGAGGVLHLNWGAIDHGGHLELVATGATLGHTLLSGIVNRERTGLGGTGWGHDVSLRLDVPVGERIDSFLGVQEALASQNLDGQPLLFERKRGQDRGAVPLLPPREGRIGVVVFGPDASWIGRAWDLILCTLA